MLLSKNYLYLSAAEMATKVVTFVAIAYLARTVGPEAYGYFEFAASALFCAGLIVDQGLGPYGALKLASPGDKPADLIWQIVTLRFGLAFVAMLALLAVAFVGQHPPVVTLLLVIYAVDLMVMPFLFHWVYQGYDRMGTVALLNVIRQFLFAIVVLAFVKSPSEVWLVAVAEGVGIAGAVLYGLWHYRRHYGAWVGTRLTFSWQMLRESSPIGASQIFWVIRMYGATLILGLIAPSQDVGWFGAAMRIFVAMHAFVYLYFFNHLPGFGRAWQLHDTSFERMIAHSLLRVTWLCLFAVPIWIIASDLVMRVVFGASFLPGAAALAWLGVVFGATWLDGHYRFGLISAGRQKDEMTAQLIGSAVAVPLIVVLYNAGGVGGAAAALVVAELVVWTVAWLYARSALDLRNHFVLLARYIPGAALVFALLWTTTTFAIPVRLVLVLVPVALYLLTFDRQFRAAVLPLLSPQNSRLRERLGRLVNLRSI